MGKEVELKDRIVRSAARRIRKVGNAVTGFSIRKKVRLAAGSGADVIFSHTNREELVQLFMLAADCPEGTNALEIGSYVGASTCYLASALKSRGSHLFCVDTWQNETMPEGQRDTLAEFVENTRRVSEVITKVRKYSTAITEQDLKLPLHFVFIDGDHSYEAVKADLAKVRPWVAMGGVVAFHDCAKLFPGVVRVIGEALATGEWNPGGLVGTLFWACRQEMQP